MATITEKIAERLGFVKATKIPALIGSYLTAQNDGIAPEKSYGQLVDAYKSWVYTCIDKIAKTVAMLPLHMYVFRNKRGEKLIDVSAIVTQLQAFETVGERKYWLKENNIERVEIFNHPFLELMKRPNSVMTRFMLWYETVMRMELAGMCGWYIERNGLGLPGRILPMPLTKSATLKPKVTATMEIERWTYLDGSIRQYIDPHDMIMLKYPHPASPFMGMSPLIAQTYPYDIDLFLMQQQRSLFKNMAVPGLHLHTDQQLQPEQVKQLKALLLEEYGAAKQSGTPFITHSGLAAEKTAFTAKDNMLIGVAKWAREKLITSYDLSEGKLGLVTDVNRANLEALDATFVKECMRPKCMLINEAIDTFLLPVYDTGLTTDFELPDTGDRTIATAERESNLKTGLTIINEERGKMGLGPVEWGEKPWLPFSLIQYGSEPPAPPPPDPNAGKASRPWSPGIDTDDKSRATRIEGTRRRHLARMNAYEKIFGIQLQMYFRSVLTEVTTRLHQFGHRTESMYAGWSRKKIEQHIAQKGIADDVNINKAKEKARLLFQFTPVTRHIVEDAGNMMVDALDLNIAFNANDSAVNAWIGRRMDTFSQSVADTTFDEIQSILRDGFTEGKPLSAIADVLRDKFASAEKYRAALISRTEVLAASNRADIFAITQAGVADTLLKCWLTAGDDTVRESHREAEVRYADGIPIDESFVVNGDEMDAPGNGSDPGENINCRCTCEFIKSNE